MSVDYQARLVIGVPVSKEDFVETREVIHTACKHPEAQGKKFCPECGLPSVARSNICEREFPRPSVATHPMFRDMDAEDGEDLGWFEEQLGSGYAEVNGLSFVNLNDPEARERAWVLGVIPLKSGGRGHSTRHQVDASEISGCIHRVQDKVREVGIRDRTVQAYCCLVCS